MPALSPPPTLPIPASELPEKIRKFAGPNAPTPAKAMAAKGLVPVKGADLVTLLVQLSVDGDEGVAQTADEQLGKLPDGVLGAACEAEVHPAVLEALTRRFLQRTELIERIVQNRAAAPATIVHVARSCDERMAELVATNQQRLLAAPQIIEALYKNENTRMSTADRLVELAARNGVELEGIPSFKAHVEAIQGQLIPEATDEPLPSDAIFQEAIESDDQDEEAIERDKADGTETLKDKHKPLHFRIGQMSISEKIRLAIVGKAAARAILVRDPNRLVSSAAIGSPSMTDNEVVAIAHSKEVNEDVLRFIGNKKDWSRNYEIKRALITNPKTPVATSMRFIPHLRDNDLRAVARSRNVSAAVKQAANQRLQMKQRSK